jgi:MFS family permease
MSEEKQRRVDAVAGKGAWGAVFCWTGIYLLRLLIGLVLGALLAGIYFAVSPFLPTDYDYERGIVTVLSVLVLTITLVTFLPLWRGLEKVNIRGFANTVSATGKLLVPAILLQLFVPLSGEIGLGIVNFAVAVGVCYLVTLAQDFDRRSQFVALLIAGGQAISMCLASMILDPDAPIDRWQVKTAVWLGAVPPVVLMVILYKRSHQFLPGSSPEKLVPANKEGGR